jgi:4-hydroxybenzoate polyprenyltransferase
MKSNERNISHPDTLPICVDLDETLVATDTLYETVLSLVASNPYLIFSCLWWITGGKAVFKSKVCTIQKIDVENLPWNEALIEWLKLKRTAGHQIILATASHDLIAKAVADHLNLFDGVICSDGTTNLKGERKAQSLVHQFGKRGFIYVGDSKADLAVWRHASAAVVVGYSARFRKSVEATLPVLASFQSRPDVNRASIAALRPEQWIKNLLVFLPLIASGNWGDLSGWLMAGGVFFALSLVASGTYIINDLLDIQADRHHFKKKYRPFAAGKISIFRGLVLYFIATLSGLVIAYQLSLLPVVISYLAISMAYSLYLKKRFLFDVLALASLYIIRICAGGEASNHLVSIWMFSFGMFVFLGLAMMKRVAELKKTEGDGSLRRRAYATIDINILSISGICSAFASAVILVLYFYFQEVSSAFKGQQILFVSVPLILYWQLKCWRAVEAERLNNDPIAFAIRDKPSLIVFGILLIVVLCARFFEVVYFPHLNS